MRSAAQLTSPPASDVVNPGRPMAIAVMRVIIWLYATNRPHLLWERPDDRQRRAGLALTVFPALLYLVAAAAPRSAC